MTNALEVDSANYEAVDIPNAYAQAIRNWNAHGPSSFPPLTPLHQLEHHLFKLYFFDVLETFAGLSENYRVEWVESKREQKWIKAAHRLTRTGEHILSSLFRVSRRGDLISTLLPDVGEKGGAIQSHPLKQPERKYELNGGSNTPVPQPIASSSTACFDPYIFHSEDVKQERDIVPVKQHSEKTRLPVLPPEIVRTVFAQLVASFSAKFGSSFLGRRRMCRVRYDELTECVLVNKTWYRAGMPFLLNYVMITSAQAAYRFSKCFFGKNLGNEAWPSRMWVVNMVLHCRDRLDIWRILVRNLSLFPNLRKLSLVRPPTIGDVSMLFDQDLPSLQQLEFDSHPDGPRSWDYGPSVDRERARAFFSRLSLVEYDGDIEPEHAESCPAFLDAAHPNLRQIKFPYNVPPTVEQRFFETCSDALSVVCMGSPTLSPSASSILGTRCTGLRAFKYDFSESIDLDGFEIFMQFCGPQLVALEIGDNCLSYAEQSLLLSIAKHCRSLELFHFTSCLDDAKPATEEAILHLLQLCGRTFRHFRLNLTDEESPDREWDFVREDLLEMIADCCPNLRTLSLDLPFENRSDSGSSRLDSVGKLLEKCKHLQTLSAFDAEELESDPILRAKIGHLCTDFSIPDYFDWRFHQSSRGCG